MDSLRLEKGYRHWSHELDSETSPVEARLMKFVDLQKVSTLPIYVCHGLLTILCCIPFGACSTDVKR